MGTVRLRRLQADFERLQEYIRRHPRVELVQHQGNPPEQYQIRYRIRSLRQKADELLNVDDHLVEIVLPRHYPRTPPQCRMLTPVFHPNIAPHAICIGDHWSAGETLVSIVTRIGEMLAYQSYNTKSPLNGEAARWVSEHIEELPLDNVTMDIEDPGPPVRSPEAPVPTRIPAPAPAPTPSVPASGGREIICTSCAARLPLPAHFPGTQARCPRCRTVLTIAAGPS